MLCRERGRLCLVNHLTSPGAIRTRLIVSIKEKER